ncbi:protein-glutamine gamma-glutamyltransferase 5-like isoform 2-T2 [Discoglossus pictus]
MDTGLIFQSVDLQPKINNKDHRTSEISTKRLIVRRGQAFSIQLNFRGRGINEKTDNISFIVETGTPRLDSYRDRKTFPLSTSSGGNEWAANVTGSTGKSTHIAIDVPPNAIIGPHNLKIQLPSKWRVTSHILGELVILFNPWCPEDEVFMADEEERKEYVLNESGFVCVGNSDWISQHSWDYGQFDEDIMDICLKLLDRSREHFKDKQKDYSRRHDPVYVSRVISAMINSNDDNGVLEGRWNGDYGSGTSPTKWNGSTAILRQWASTGFRPVKYGQCWVFASVLCTAMRCLGVPTRVVTNFVSAHDTDGNLYVDQFYDIKGNLIEKGRKDSIWNFHVWNECWMVRRDLPAGYGGWQVLDATPQELSNEIFCCGPASVKAIKEGEVHLNYDAPFVFAEVNADVISWVVYPDSSRKERTYSDTRHVGRNISTKSVGKNVRLDITNNYKYKEGSDKERTVFEKALVARNGPSPSDREEANDPISPNLPISDAGVELKLKLMDSPVVGQDINLILVASNLTSKNKNININMSVQSMQNDGRPKNLVWQKEDAIELDPEEVKQFHYHIPYLMYRKYLTDSNLLKVSTLGELNDIRKPLLVERNITLATPGLEIEATGNAVVREPYTVIISFNNTLKEELNNCTLTLEGSGLIGEVTETPLGPIKAGHGVRVHIELVPYKSGDKTLQVLFNSDKIKFIRGSKDIAVSPALT